MGFRVYCLGFGGVGVSSRNVQNKLSTSSRLLTATGHDLEDTSRVRE